MSEPTIGDIMVKNVVTVNQQQTLGDAVRVMGKHGIRHLVVTRDDGRPAGLFSQRAVFQHLARVWSKNERPSEVSVTDFMTTDMITLSPKTPVHQAAQIMATRRIGCLPVVLNNRLVGIVTTVDILRKVVPGTLTDTKNPS